MTDVQPDLFGEFDRAADEAARKQLEREVWLSRFERRSFLAPYESAGSAKGATIIGWVCPACDAVEWNDYRLQVEHGWDMQRPGDVADLAGPCLRQRWQAMREARR